MAKDTKFVLIDDEGDVNTFESENDLEEYLQDMEYDQDALDVTQVFAYTKEYRVKAKGYELEEVEE